MRDPTPPPPSPPGHRIVFVPAGRTGEIEHGTTVLEAARRLGVDLDTVCGGRGICGRCQIEPSAGSFPKWAIVVDDDALGPATEVELAYRGSRPLGGRRLGCAATIVGDVVVDVPPESQVHRQVVRKDLDLPPVVVDPSFTLCYVELDPPELGDDARAAAALADAIADQHHRVPPLVEPRVAALLGRALAGRADAPAVTVAIDERDVVTAVWPGFVERGLGVAVDVGSTTIAAHLCDVTSGEILASAGRMNPQIRFGEDLMSRVSYAMMHANGAHELTTAVRVAVDELIGELLDQCGEPRDRVLEVVAVGNPIMHHLLLGFDPVPLGQAPFTLATDQPVITAAAEVGLALWHARCYAGPCIAGHVGADTAAAILATADQPADEPAAGVRLLVDVGTNAEIVLRSGGELFAASSPTGPAFEGAQLSCGQRATAAAIERVRIDRDTLEPEIRVIGAVGSRPSDVRGVCGSGVIDAIAEMYLAGVIDRHGVIRGELADRTSRVVAQGRTFAYVVWRDPTGAAPPVLITQNDVRAVQLAKAALRAGVELLLERVGRPPVDEVLLTGAFGAHIDPVRAMVLGMVPDCDPARVRSVGNAAGAGAVQALLSRAARTEMEVAARRVTKVETAIEPRFQELFVDAMAIPHDSAPTPQLGAVVELPVERSATSSARRRRRERVAT